MMAQKKKLMENRNGFFDKKKTSQHRKMETTSMIRKLTFVQ